MTTFLDLKSMTDVTQNIVDEKSAAHFLMSNKLIPDSAKCAKCHSEMKLRTRGSSYECIKTIVLWVHKYSAKQVSNEVQISEQTVVDWRNFLRELCCEIESSYGKIGGNDNIIEIDETNIHSKKYGIGKSAGEDWICGGLDRVTGRVFAKRVENRTAKVLVPLLQQNIDQKSIVYSDEWRSYSQLKKYFTSHFTVCHKTQFVNLVGSRKVCTNGIESVWSRLKEPFRNGHGTSQALIDSYISEFVVRENEKDHFYAKMIEAIRSKCI